MSILSRIKQKPSLKPPRLVIHGKGGVGKTTFAASMRAPIFIPFEEGLGVLEVPHFPQPADYSEAMEMLDELRRTDHPYSSLAIDTIDHLEPLVWAHVCTEASDNKRVYENIEDFGFGKGYLKADPYWVDFFHGLDALRREKDMTICVLSHNEVKTLDDPAIGPYDRVAPKLHKRANALLHEWADIVGYLDIERTSIEKEGSKGRTVTTAQVTGRRLLHLEDKGGFVAKNRYSLPARIEIPEKEPFGALRNELIKKLRPAAPASESNPTEAA